MTQKAFWETSLKNSTIFDIKEDVKLLDEKQGSKTIQQQQNQKQNEDNVQKINTSRPPCRKRYTPHEASELSDLRILLELKNGYKPSMEEVQDQYQLKMMEKKN